MRPNIYFYIYFTTILWSYNCGLWLSLQYLIINIYFEITQNIFLICMCESLNLFLLKSKSNAYVFITQKIKPMTRKIWLVYDSKDKTNSQFFNKFTYTFNIVYGKNLYLKDNIKKKIHTHDFLLSYSLELKIKMSIINTKDKIAIICRNLSHGNECEPNFLISDSKWISICPVTAVFVSFLYSIISLLFTKCD